MRTEFLCVSVLRVASGPRVKLACCKSALNPPLVCSTDRSKAVVPVLVLLYVALWFILRGDLLYVVPCVILFLCFSVLLVLRLPRLGKRELILVRFVRLFGLCLFGFVGFLFLLGSGKGCGLWLWHSVDFSLTFFNRFLQIAYLLRTLVLPKTPNISCLFNLFIKFRLLKQGILFFCVVFRLSHLSISQSGDVRCQDLEKTWINHASISWKRSQIPAPASYFQIRKNIYLLGTWSFWRVNKLGRVSCGPSR